MKKYLPLITLITFLSCGKSDEHTACENNLDNAQQEISNITYQLNQLRNDYNTLNANYQNLKSTYEDIEYNSNRYQRDYSGVINTSKSQINDILRKINWEQYNDLDQIVKDLKEISILREY